LRNEEISRKSVRPGRRPNRRGEPRVGAGKWGREHQVYYKILACIGKEKKRVPGGKKGHLWATSKKEGRGPKGRET